MTVMAATRRVAAGVVLVLVGGWLLAAQGTSTTRQGLYLLAGTPGAGDFALEMFSVSAGGIAHVREVIAPPESGGQLCAGFLAAFDDEQGHIFVVSPADPGICPPAITVLHENDPGRVDMISGFIAPVPARAGHRIFFPFVNFALAVAANGGSSFALVAGGLAPAWTITRVPAEFSSRESRVVAGSWDDYRGLRFAGATGGPYAETFPVLEVRVNGFGVPRLGVPHAFGAVIAPLPPTIPSGIAEADGSHVGTGAHLLAATDRFFVASFLANGFGATTAYVYDRSLGTYRTLTIPTPASRPMCRIYGPWLAVVETQPRENNAEHPGSENERTVPTVDGPRIREEYEDYAEHFFLPGRLLLINLVDGRRVTLATGQEDSEVLGVDSEGNVLYRTNDSLWSVKIEGDKPGTPALIAKDPVIADVHWAFFSSAARGGRHLPGGVNYHR